MRGTAAIAFVLAAACLLPGCGGDDSKASHPGSSSEEDAGRDPVVAPDASETEDGGEPEDAGKPDAEPSDIEDGGELDAEPSDADAAEDPGVDDAGSDTGEPDADTGPPKMRVEIHFQGKVGDEAFACGQSYAGAGTTGTTVTPSDFRMFLEKVQLLRTSDGKPVDVEFEFRVPWQTPDVAMIDFEDAQGRCATFGTPETNTVLTGFVEEGTYDGIVLTNGVPRELNHSNPTQLDPPLGGGPLHWGWRLGFIFFKAELVQVDGAGLGFCHVGSGACGTGSLSNVVCQRSARNIIVLPEFDPATQKVVVDLEPLFAVVDLTQDMQCHSDTVEHCGAYYNELGLDFESGAGIERQSVYSVE